MSLQSLGISKMNLADRKGRGTPLLIRRKRIANAPILVIDIPRDFSREFSHTSSLCEQDHMATVPELSPGHELSPCTLNAAPSSPATTPTPADTNVQIQHRPAVSLPAVLLSPACLQLEGCRRSFLKRRPRRLINFAGKNALDSCTMWQEIANLATKWQDI